MSTTLVAEVKDKRLESVDDATQTINQAFERLQANRWRVSKTTAAERIVKLKKLREAILSRKEELFAAMWEDFHKPAAEVELTELQPVLAEIKHAVDHLHDWMKPKKVPTPIYLFGTKSVVRYEPKGLVLILSPWNYPFNLLMSPLVAAIAAGNCVMMRPSDKVRQTSAFMKSLIDQVFSPDEAVMFTGNYKIGNIMLELPFDHIFFTGSTRIGKEVMVKAAQHLASVTLELGGQSPVIVDETADIAAAAERITWAKFINGGQTCIAPNHIFVHESKVNAFVDVVKKRIVAQYGATDEERKASPHFPRIVDESNQKRLAALVSRTVASGAKLEIGGDEAPAERYLAPTVLSGVTAAMPVMEEEIFGPIMPIIAYKNIDEVIADIHSRGKPLAMYIFSDDKRKVENYLSSTTAGGTVINNCIIHLANGDLPFGGIGESGLGSYHGFWGFRTLSHERSTMEQKKPASINMFYPPYTDKVQKLMGFMTKYMSR